MIIVVMGVCGSGKTTIGSYVADKLGWSFADADEFHSKENKMKMSAGLPLSDQDRVPWLQSIHRYANRLSQNHKSGVITCSALKKVYRDVLRYGDSHLLHNKQHSEVITDTCGTKGVEDTSVQTIASTDNGHTEPALTEELHNQEKESSELSVEFIHLTGSREVLQTRMMNRQGHFMPATLLQSQLDIVEALDEQEAGFTVDIDKSVEEIAEEIISRLCI